MIVSLPQIVIELKVRGMCCLPYPNHPKGCPNFKHKHGCPPECPPFSLTAPWFAIINEFDFAAHVARMKTAHPAWTQRQLECCLYWQPAARKALQTEIKRFLNINHHFDIDSCPEAGGVNITKTLALVGINLEWPPVNVARQVVIAGKQIIVLEKSIAHDSRDNLSFKFDAE
jgi:hypothetical protein